MIKIILALLFVHITSVSIGQVGIGTTSPQETLHINGTLRIDSTDQPTVFTTKLFGLNADGTLREIGVGTNLSLVSNVLSASGSGGSAFDHSFGSIDLVDLDEHNDVNLMIGPGGLNEGKTIIKINRLVQPSKGVSITGFVAGYDGQHIWIYAQNGSVTLKPQDAAALIAANRIEVNTKTGAKIWGMIELVYDGLKSRWVIMQHHE